MPAGLTGGAGRFSAISSVAPFNFRHSRPIEKSHGILIRKTLLTESSLIVHWCSLEHGFIRTVAKGARRPASGFAGKLDLFYSADLVWQPAKKSELHLLKEVDVTDFRLGLQATWLRVLCASYFVKLLESAAEPGTPVPGLYDLLRRALDYLTAHEPARKAVLHFEKELAQELGVHGGEGTAPITALRQMLHRVPEQRDDLLGQLES
jgi:DNA repair protein RecO (recombination protein O)